MLKMARSLAILISERELNGVMAMPRWYGLAYRRYDVRYVVLALIPLNLIMRYAVGFYWLVYGFIKHGGWHTKMDDAYWRGFNDGNIEREHHIDRLARMVRGEQ